MTDNSVVASVETITPTVAAQLLELNEGNRLLRPRHVQRLARDMAQGRFVLTGEPIIVNGDRLLDGQHRLEACVLSGVAIQCLVVRGISSEAMPMIDKGISRTLGDTLGWKDTPNRNQAAAVVRRVAALIDGVTLRDTGKVTLYTDQQLVAMYDVLGDDIQVAIKRAAKVSKAVGRPITVWAVALCWLSLNSDDDQVEAFTELLVGGAGLEAGSPILALRNWTMRSVAQRKTLRPDELLIATVKAYNAWLGGHDLKLIRISPSDALPEVAR